MLILLWSYLHLHKIPDYASKYESVTHLKEISDEQEVSGNSRCWGACRAGRGARTKHRDGVWQDDSGIRLRRSGRRPSEDRHLSDAERQRDWLQGRREARRRPVGVVPVRIVR